MANEFPEKNIEEGQKKLDQKELVGLAFSGGGIRSASFNLGVLQCLQKCRLLSRVDYLSTVSGGGYLGSCLSSLLAGNPPLTPFGHIQGNKEPAEFAHLRNNSEYLAPKGFFDLLIIPGLVIRGMLINLSIPLFFFLSIAGLLLYSIRNTEQASLPIFVAGHLDSFLGEHFPLVKFLGDNFIVTKVLAIIFLFIALIYPIILSFIQSTPDKRNLMGKSIKFILISLVISAFIEAQPMVITMITKWFENGNLNVYSTLGTITSFITFLFSHKLAQKTSKLAQTLGLYALGMMVFLILWWILLILFQKGITRFSGGWFDSASKDTLIAYAAIWGALLIYIIAFVDINFTSIHNFYRDRLSEAYLIKYSNDSVTQNDGQRLSTLSPLAPYHLINVAVNETDPDARYKKGRGADFFFFSKNYLGGDRTGYCVTKEMEKVVNHLDLASAMAISGAAAAPNMGKATIKPLIPLITLLNVRLNYWLPNPAYVGKRFYKKPGFLYFLREMIGSLSADTGYVNLSDGGHIENLGAYELLRRRCKLIIVGDGECDPDYQFEALCQLIRIAQIDLAVSIEMDGLDNIRSGLQSYAIGNIIYSRSVTGTLIYLKSSLTGDHNLMSSLPDHECFETSKLRKDNMFFDAYSYIAHYKAKNPDFPHESTGDQFFDEAQFESYRALGYKVACEILAPPSESPAICHKSYMGDSSYFD